MPRGVTQIGQFAIIPLWVVERCKDPGALRLYTWLAARYANQKHEAWPSQTTLAADLEVSTDSVQRHLQMLRDCGVLCTVRRGGTGKGAQPMVYVLVQVDPEQSRTDAVLDGEAKPHVRGGKAANDPIAIRKNQIQEPDPSTPVTATEQMFRDRPDLRPQPLPPRKRKGKHATHVFCGSYMCVDADKHARFEKRWQVAAGDDDLDLLGTYKDVEKEFGESGSTENPAFFLEKYFTKLLQDEFGRDQARA